MGAENYATLCDLGILVDQVTEPVPAQNAHTGLSCGRMHSPCGRVLLQPPVWSVKDIVIGIFAQDQSQEPFPSSGWTAPNSLTLSACSTAETTPVTADEAVHIAPAFQPAGYSHVVATLWPVGDTMAVRVCDEFYRIITADGTRGPSTSLAALALHQAVRSLRDDHRGNPFVWAGYLYVGT